MVSQSESRRVHKPQQWEGDRLKKRDNEREIGSQTATIWRRWLGERDNESKIGSQTRERQRVSRIGWYPSLRKIFFMGEFQRIWGVSSPTHIPLATQDIPLFLKHIIWISGLKWSINSRSHTVFFQKATRLETVRAGLYMQQWWKLYIELVNHFCPVPSCPPHLSGY